jgi:ribonuclease T2
MKKIIGFGLILVSSVLFAIPVSGHFDATKTCPTYLSKNSKSNPGNISVQSGQSYVLKEINTSAPNWFRVEIAPQEQRWVDGRCGVADYMAQAPVSCSDKNMADSYILALSSQAGFCETYGYEAGKPECMHLSSISYESSHFTLHGLWPNKDSCGQRYGYCNVKARANHCDYAPLALSSEVTNNLRIVMPSFNHGSCLERHEWNKHGSCQSHSADEYFSVAMRLTKEADQSALGEFIQGHKGDVVPLKALRQAIINAFGKENATKVYLGCKNKVLVDIFIHLPANLDENDTLMNLINTAPYSSTPDSCPAKVMISNFDKDSWI